jgi:ABC-2 type transport system ATP-binding protein
MRQLSGGMKRRMLVAQALVHKPPVIVLDEPTAGVDVELRQTLWQFISGLNKQGTTVLLTTHYLEEAEALCGRIAMLKAGVSWRWTAPARCSSCLRQCAAFQDYRCIASGAGARARVTGSVVQLPAHSALEIEQFWLQVRESGLVVEDVEMRKADLEDVFIEIMNRHSVGWRIVSAPGR